jgi:hypothetical protein
MIVGVPLILGTLLLAGSALAAVPTLDQAGEPVKCDPQGVLQGPGYSLELPKGFRHCDTWPRSDYVPLGTDAEERYVLISWSYNASVDADLHASVSESVDTTVRDKQYTLIGREKTTLAGLAAERVVFHYRDDTLQDDMVLDDLQALSARTGSGAGDHPSAYWYEASLVTSTAHYAEDRKKFEQLLKLWRRHPK